MKKVFSVIIVLLAVIMTTAPAMATLNPTKAPSATAAINGTVLDYQSGETLAGVAVSVEGTDLKVYTDLDGNFTINNLEPGTYNLVLSMISYKSSLVENLELQANEKELIDIKLDNIR
jgi:uncharacterized surface anchored protein